MDLPTSSNPAAAGPKTPLTGYQWKLFGFLSVASLFEGYDFFALSQLLPEIRGAFEMSESAGGALVAAINAGTIAAYFLIRQTDRLGRRKLLMITILGYTIFTALTAAAWDPWSFGACQFIARAFLIAEWAVTMVYAAEEFPADRRGMVIGVISAMNSLGAIICAGVVPLMLDTVLEWRMVYLVGIVPLIVIMVWRRGLKESSRFQEIKPDQREPFFAVLKGPHGKRVLQMGAIWFGTYLCTQTSVTFWKEYALSLPGDKALTKDDVGLMISIAAVASMPLVFFAGKLLDIVGRKIGAVIIFTVMITSVIAMYTLESKWALTGMLIAGIFGVSAVLPVLNAFSTELFPTRVRSNAFAWANNIIGRIGYVSSPLVVGFLAEAWGWGPAVSLTVIGPAVALVFILLWLPETKGKELEDITGEA